MSARPSAKGWCPGAWRPMMSGDGLVVRIRPRLGRLTRAQVLGLCDLARRHGSGIVGLTNRVNVQIRSVRVETHDALLEGLAALDLLDADPALEGRRNIIASPFWQSQDLTFRLAEALLDRLADLPDLPAKFGYAVDTGPVPMLPTTSADVRLERTADGALLLRADGSATGRVIAEDHACDEVIGLASWFAERAAAQPRSIRMARLLENTPLPDHWTGTPPRPFDHHAVKPEETALGPLVGIAFGQIGASELALAIEASRAEAIRVTPWRMVLFEGGTDLIGPEFITSADDPLLTVDACPGAPFCTQATVETRFLARGLAPRAKSPLHVSGCSKGCARNRPAALTLVGRDGRFDIVRDGCASDQPMLQGVSPDSIASTILTT